MSFKDKPLKKCHTDKRKMIDDIHLNLIKNLDEESILDYYQENGLLLNEYYSNNNINKIQITNNSGILNYFSNPSIQQGEEEKEDKRDIINEYMSNIDDTIINNYYKDYNYNKCETCKINMSLDEIKGIMLCPQCGNTKDIICLGVGSKTTY